MQLYISINPVIHQLHPGEPLRGSLQDKYVIPNVTLDPITLHALSKSQRKKKIVHFTQKTT